MARRNSARCSTAQHSIWHGTSRSIHSAFQFGTFSGTFRGAFRGWGPPGTSRGASPGSSRG
eukprot:9452557-Pyramimonas_sp.AAC.1